MIVGLESNDIIRGQAGPPICAGSGDDSVSGDGARPATQSPWDRGLDMRSGIRDFVDQPLIDGIDRAPAAHLTPDQAPSFVPREVDKADAFFEYSNTNYTLLGQLIVKITGVSYAAALHRDLLGPAELTRVAVQDVDLARGVTGPDPYVPNRAFASVGWSAGSIAADDAASRPGATSSTADL